MTAEANLSRWHNLHLSISHPQSHSQSMLYKILEVESRLFNRNIIQLGSETDAVDYAENEQKLIEDKNPYYIQHQLDAGDLTGIHAFEDLGFRFIEFRIFRHLENIDPFKAL